MAKQNHNKRNDVAILSGSSLVVGVIASSVLLVLGLLLISLVVAVTDWDDISLVATVVQVISVAVGGFISGRIAQKTGWLHGGLVGLVYQLLTTILMGGGLGAIITLNFAWRGSLAFLVGVIGGMVGVNSGR